MKEESRASIYPTRGKKHASQGRTPTVLPRPLLKWVFHGRATPNGKGSSAQNVKTATGNLQISLVTMGTCMHIGGAEVPRRMHRLTLSVTPRQTMTVCS